MSQKQVTLFKYVTGGQEVTYLDDQGLYDAETIRKHWQGTFPELGNCQAETVAKRQTVTVKVEGVDREVEVDRLITYVKKVGTKGCGDLVIVDPEAPGHTPGPWYVSDEGYGVVAIRDEGQRLYIAIAETIAGTGHRKANAHLMAAAPRMLVQLQQTRDLLKTLLEVAIFLHGNRQTVIDRVARLEAVIAEATGEGGRWLRLTGTASPKSTSSTWPSSIKPMKRFGLWLLTLRQSIPAGLLTRKRLRNSVRCRWKFWRLRLPGIRHGDWQRSFPMITANTQPALPATASPAGETTGLYVPALPATADPAIGCPACGHTIRWASGSGLVCANCGHPAALPASIRSRLVAAWPGRGNWGRVVAE